MTRFLTRKLKRGVNEQKSQVAKVNPCVFLGFTFSGKGKLRGSDRGFENFRHRLRRLTGRSWGGLDGIPAQEARAVCARLDGVLWDLGLLSTRP
jgi:hypothetical protein